MLRGVLRGARAAQVSCLAVQRSQTAVAAPAASFAMARPMPLPASVGVRHASSGRPTGTGASTFDDYGSTGEHNGEADDSFGDMDMDMDADMDVELDEDGELVEEVDESGHKGPAYHWDKEEGPPPPSFKRQASTSKYTNSDIPGNVFVAPHHPGAPGAVHGIGVPAELVVRRPKMRRDLRPKHVQDVPHPMITYTEGPREMGHKIIRTFVGHVVSDKMNKTVAVEVSQYYRHPKYHKYIKSSRKFLTHDENEECNIGDVVEIRTCRPLSRHKHFTLHRVLKPRLPIAEGAARFEEHAPAWKKPGLTPEERQKAEDEAGAAAAQAMAEQLAKKADKIARRAAERQAKADAAKQQGASASS